MLSNRVVARAPRPRSSHALGFRLLMPRADNKLVTLL